MSLTESQVIMLHRAGFTDAQISQHKLKFCNLFNVHPCYNDELKMLRELPERIRFERESAVLEYQQSQMIGK